MEQPRLSEAEIIAEAIRTQEILEISEVVKNVAREQITVSTVDKALDVEKYDSPDFSHIVLYADIQILSNNIRVTSDGKTTPSAIVGKTWYPDETYRVWGKVNMRNLRFIRESADATIVVDYWGRENVRK